MRLLIATIQKEFLQFFRNRILLFLVLIAPVVVLGVIPLSFDGGYRLRAGVCNSDYNLISGNSMIEKVIYYNSLVSAREAMDRGELDLILITDAEEKRLILDGTFPRRAMASVYAISKQNGENESQQVVFQTLFNRGKVYKHYYLISLVIMIITILGAALIALNIVNERESGVEEQFKASLMDRRVYMTGKLLFFLILFMAEISLCYLFCYLVYGLFFSGSLLLLFAVSLLFTFNVLGLGMVIASFSNTQLRAVYILTITLVLMIMLSTMFSHLSTMPYWAAATRFVNPVWYGVESAREVILMGAKPGDVVTLLFGMGVFGVMLILCGVYRR